jgi:hypothetical protein
MQRFYYSMLIGLCLMSGMGGCRKESATQSVYRIEPKLQTYLDLFVSEGRQRGVDLVLKNLIIEFGKNTDEGICGTCRQTPSDPDLQRTIIIDTSGICWSEVTEDAREALVFHELGHCLLKRLTHKNATLPNGDLASVMNGQGDMGVYGVCSYDIGGSNGNDCDKRYRRSYYLDELFNENTPTPDWGK